MREDTDHVDRDGKAVELPMIERPFKADEAQMQLAVHAA